MNASIQIDHNYHKFSKFSMISNSFLGFPRLLHDRPRKSPVMYNPQNVTTRKMEPFGTVGSPDPIEKWEPSAMSYLVNTMSHLSSCYTDFMTSVFQPTGYAVIINTHTIAFINRIVSQSSSPVVKRQITWSNLSKQTGG